MRVKNVPTEPISVAASDLWQCPVGPVQACQGVVYGTPFAAALIGEDDRLAVGNRCLGKSEHMAPRL